MPRCILGLTGLPGAKKTLTAELISQYEIPVFSMSSVIYKEVTNRGLKPSPKNLFAVSLDLRNRYGKGIIAERITQDIKKINKPIVCVDGIRNLEEIKVLRKITQDFFLICIHASPKTRFERISRSDGSPIKSWADFSWLDKQNLELGIGDVIAKSDYMIINEEYSTLDLKSAVQKLMNYVRTWFHHSSEQD